MKPTTPEWVDKAEADFAAATLLRRSRKKFSRDIVCFHLQQCVEKYLKARLIEAAIPFPKTHDLEQLLDLILPVEPLWGAWRPSLAAISNYAVLIRYPGNSVTPVQARESFAAAKRMRALIRQSLGLP